MKDIVIIKIGSRILTDSDGQTDLNNLRSLVGQISTALSLYDIHIAIVTSGAITCGSTFLNDHPNSIPEKQAAAAIGHPILFQDYSLFFKQHGFTVGQLLVTRDGLDDENRAHHCKNTIETLFQNNVIPIINENDSVSIDELTFGDNDVLSSMAAKLIKAKHLILLTDTDGLYTANPNNDTSAKLIPELQDISEELNHFIDDDPKSRGGMTSKIMAAKTALEHDIEVTIANGRKPDIVLDILSGKSVGTHIRKQS